MASTRVGSLRVNTMIFPSLGFSASDGVGFGLLVFVVIYVGLTLKGFVSWQIAPPPTQPVDEVAEDDVSDEGS